MYVLQFEYRASLLQLTGFESVLARGVSLISFVYFNLPHFMPTLQVLGTKLVWRLPWLGYRELATKPQFLLPGQSALFLCVGGRPYF